MSTGSKGVEQGKPRWLVPALVATSLLISLAIGAYLVFGRELFQRPLLAIAVVSAWLGALVGITIGSDPGGVSGRTDGVKPYPMREKQKTKTRRV
jgi:hypothetical protein